MIEAEVVIELSTSACALPPIFARHGGHEPAPTFSTFVYRPHLGREFFWVNTDNDKRLSCHGGGR